MRRLVSFRSRWLCLAVAALMLACHTTRSLGIHELEIVLDGDGCPIDVDPPTGATCDQDRSGKTCVKKNDKLSWVADRPFAIYFDPIRGRPIKSPTNCSGSCKTQSLPFDPDAPPSGSDEVDEVEYKYTVVVEGCRKPLDPPIFIQK
jgi:hypothetical protein